MLSNTIYMRSFCLHVFLNEKKNVSRIGNNRVGDKSIGKNKFANVFKKNLLKQIKSQYAFSSENSLANEPIFGGVVFRQFLK